MSIFQSVSRLGLIRRRGCKMGILIGTYRSIVSEPLRGLVWHLRAMAPGGKTRLGQAKPSFSARPASKDTTDFIPKAIVSAI